MGYGGLVYDGLWAKAWLNLGYKVCRSIVVEIYFDRVGIFNALRNPDTEAFSFLASS